MLQHVHIKDLVIVRSLELDFQPGMTALTGETGAGKSVLIDALGIALGAKSDRDMIRSGCEKAEVSAVFDIARLPEVCSWLTENELNHDGECILRRVLNNKGRSRAFINGSPVPVALLRDLGDKLVDIHGQHEHQSLLKPAAQLRLLDGYAGHRDLLEEVALLYTRYRQHLTNLQTLKSRAEDRANRIDYLRFQADELNTLALADNELPELEQQQLKLANAERLKSETLTTIRSLYEGDDTAYQALSQAIDTVDQLAELDPAFREAREMLESSRVLVEETVSLLRSQADAMEFDPDLLIEVDDRLAEITEVARKHRLPPGELPTHLATLQRELEELTNADITLGQLETETERLKQEYLVSAQRLSKSRRQAANELSDVVLENMQHLGMKQGRFDVSFTTDDKPTARGQDKVEFLVSANPGQPLAPLNRVASGGELSRISLIIQVATAGFGEVPSLIFDEVDVGIGGAVAETVGRLLERLGNNRQVFCVTHLAQVASVAHHHFLVSKHSDGESTETDIQPLDKAQRIQEIARMLGGIEITEQTIAHAEEMINRAAVN